MQLDFYKAEIALDYGGGFVIIHNLPNEGPNNFHDAFAIWQAKSQKICAESFCDYINEKRDRGLSDHYAFSESGFEGLLETGAIYSLGKSPAKRKFEFASKTYTVEIKTLPQASVKEQKQFYLLPGQVLVQLFDGKKNKTFVMSPYDDGEWYGINANVEKTLLSQIGLIINEVLQEYSL